MEFISFLIRLFFAMHICIYGWTKDFLLVYKPIREEQYMLAFIEKIARRTIVAKGNNFIARICKSNRVGFRLANLQDGVREPIFSISQS